LTDHPFSAVPLGAGDYRAAAAGTVHDETVSDGGCTFVLVTSERDEILSQRPPRTAPGAGLTFVRAAAGDWRPSVAPGVEMRRLYSDRGRGTITALVRMAAGTRLPGHRHVTAEQLYMLSGDAQITGETLGTGDYYRTMAGTSHGVTHTKRGCEFLLISSAGEMLG
jgi:anti-sigma factor ChrR (cupin superfamily)